jgi:glycosyltransferase involved in cell wall biosynthesis
MWHEGRDDGRLAAREAGTLRILVLAPHPFFQERGTPIAVRALLEVLSRMGHQLEVLTYPEGEDVAIPNCRIERIWRVPGIRRVRPGFSLKKLILDAVMWPKFLLRLRSGRFDLVHAVEESAFMAASGAALFAVPYVYDMDSSLAQQLEERYPRLAPFRGLMERLERLAVIRSIAVLGVCRSLVEIARQHAPAKPVACVEDFSLIDPHVAGAECLSTLIGRSGPIVLYVGNLEPYQGIDLLLDGFARALDAVPDAQLVAIGGTSQHVTNYKAYAVRRGIAAHVHFLGPRPVQTLGAYLTQATVLASPRITGQNTPMKIYSYLDSGRPVLATRLPTHTQVLDDDIAMLVDPTPDAVATGLVEILSDGARRNRLAGNARTRVAAEYSREAFERKVESFYTSIARHIAPALEESA